MKKIAMLLAVAGLAAFPSVYAQGTGTTTKQTEVLNGLLATYAAQAKAEAEKLGKRAPSTDFAADIGREFYLKRRTWQERDYTCSGCHTENPTKEGKHIDTKKPIKPLAPAANPERFTDVKKVEKNFTEHCFDLHDRDCRPHEKGNFIAYLMSVK